MTAADVSGPPFAQVRRLEHHHRRLESSRGHPLLDRDRCRPLIIGMGRRHTWHDRHRARRPPPRLAAGWLTARTRAMGGVLLWVRSTGAERGRLGWLGYAPACPA